MRQTANAYELGPGEGIVDHGNPTFPLPPKKTQMKSRSSHGPAGGVGTCHHRSQHVANDTMTGLAPGCIANPSFPFQTPWRYL